MFQHLDPKNIGLDGELWTADAIAKLIPTDRVYVKKTSGTWMTTGDSKNYFLSHLRYVKDYEDYYEDIKKFISDN